MKRALLFVPMSVSLSLSLCVSFFRSTFTLSLSRVELAPNCIYWTKTKYNSNEYDTTVFTIYTRIVQCLWISWMWCDRCVRTFAQNTLGFVDTGAVGHPHHIHTIGFVWMFRFTSKKKCECRSRTNNNNIISFIAAMHRIYLSKERKMLMMKIRHWAQYERILRNHRVLFVFVNCAWTKTRSKTHTYSHFTSMWNLIIISLFEGQPISIVSHYSMGTKR